MADVITRLRVESSEYDNKIKRAAESLQAYAAKCRQVGGTLEKLDEGVLEYVRDLGKMETVNKTARGSISELTKAFTDLRIQYNQLTQAEKQSPFGKALKSSLDELKVRIQAGKKELNDISQELSGSKFGQFGSIIDVVGRKMGVNANLTELLTSRTALLTAGLGATIAAVTKGTEEWTKYNAELSKQDQTTTVVTGLDGNAVEVMTDKMRALSDTYKVDFRQAVEAANTLMSQFGETGDSATELIKDGMQGMLHGDGQKLLQMIQQYAPAFRDAGVNASQLIAVIHNSQGGIFTPENMNAIVMGIRNIRLMTDQTREALAKLGLDGQDMARKMSDGSMTVFDALKLVAGKLKDCEAGSQTTGEVMQAVFGRSGVTAGQNLAKAIEGLNTNLQQTKKQTGEVGEAFAGLQTAYEGLNAAIRETFGYDGYQEMATGIKSSLVSALSEVVEKLGQVKSLLWGMSTGQAKKERYDTTAMPDEVKRDLEALQNADESEREQLYIQQRTKYEKRYTQATRDEQYARAWMSHEGDNWFQRYNPLAIVGDWWFGRNAKSAQSAVAAENDVLSEYNKAAREIVYAKLEDIKTRSETEVIIPNPGRGSGGKETVDKIAKELNPLQDTQKMIADLTAEAFTADEERLEVIKQEVASLRAQEQYYKDIQNSVNGIKQAEAKTETGVSITTTAGMGQYISQLQSDLSHADIGSTLYQELSSQLADMNSLQGLLSESLSIGLGTAMFDVADEMGKDFWTRAMEGGVENIDWQAIVDKINEAREAAGLNKIELDFETGKIKTVGKLGSEMAKDFQNAANAIGTLGSAMNQIEDPAAKVFGIVAQAIATVAQSFAMSLKGAKDPWVWIASAIAGTATMISTIASIKSATAGNFAEGGIVPGNSFSGDNLRASDYGINSGELILNMSQQDHIASLLQDTERSSMQNMRPYATGEVIYFGLTDYLSSIGRGEIVTTKM